MIQVVRAFGLLLALLMLHSCTMPSHEDYKRAQDERACINQCALKKQACAEHCQYSCKNCEKYEHNNMTKRYKKYIHEQNVQGKRVALQLQSFRDPLQCRKISCDCPADYRVCVGQCKGKIRKRLQVKPFCC